MNRELSKIYMDRLMADGGLSFIDVGAGMVQTVSFQQNSGDDKKTIIKKMPVALDTSITEGCDFKKELPMVPNSKLKGLFYFEDRGVVSTVGRGGRSAFRSALTLVVWVNRARFSADAYGDIETAAIAEIMRKIGFNKPAHEGNLIAINPKLSSVVQQDANIFSRYTYSEVENQYLRPPFGFFAINIETEFMLNPNCIAPIEEGGPICY